MRTDTIAGKAIPNGDNNNRCNQYDVFRRHTQELHATIVRLAKLAGCVGSWGEWRLSFNGVAAH
jgi:hypothetical protein